MGSYVVISQKAANADKNRDQRFLVQQSRRQGKTSAQAALLEKDIEKSCVDLLKRAGWFVFKIHSAGSRGKAYGHKGISDRIAVKRGRVLFLEIKKSDGKKSEDQIKFEDDIKTHGGEYHLIRSVEDLMVVINAW